MFWRPLTPLLAIALAAAPARAATKLTEVTAYPGVLYATYTTGGASPTIIHVVTLDLSSSEVTIIATSTGERGQKPSAYAAQRGAQVVINGDLFAPATFRPAGIARGDALTWDDTADTAVSGFASFSKGVGGTEVVISSPAEVVSLLPASVSAAIGGRPLLVSGGAALAPSCDDAPTLACVAAPRTALARSADGRTLYLVVADGWQPGSFGLRAAELAAFLATDLDAATALQLDSGSASAMFIDNQGGLVSSPSEGAERTVANHLAVLHGPLPPGSIQGGVFDTVVAGDKIIGATVRLDTGAETIYTGDVLWSFVVPPRFVCATGSAIGYQDQTQCRQVFSGVAEFASMALLPDGAARPDAGTAAGDAGDGDGGTIGPPPDGCGCQGAAPSPIGALAVLAWLLVTGLRRRAPL